MLGSAVAPQNPAFPNMPLIVFGSLTLGLGVGVLVGLLMEMFGRRVRGPEDLWAAIDAPLIAVIAAPRVAKGQVRLTKAPPFAALTGPREVAAPTSAAA